MQRFEHHAVTDIADTSVKIPMIYLAPTSPVNPARCFARPSRCATPALPLTIRLLLYASHQYCTGRSYLDASHTPPIR